MASIGLLVASWMFVDLKPVPDVEISAEREKEIDDMLFQALGE